MSDLIADIIIYLLLVAGIGFGGISLMGLLIFPDIRSRMYTALRSSLISMVAIIGAAIVYAIALRAGNGGDQYMTFLFHTIFLAAIMAIAIMAVNRLVLEKTHGVVYCGTPPPQNTEEKPEAP
jgi:multisubunit Na+/H+ antiporter MnhG subunit